MAIIGLVVLSISLPSFSSPFHTESIDVRGERVEVVKDRVVMEFKEHVSPSTRRGIIRILGEGIVVGSPGTGRDDGGGNFVVVELEGTHKGRLKNVLDLLNVSGDVRVAEPDYICSMAASDVPDDPLFPYQWYLQSMSEVWSIESGNPSVVIAVLDTGIAYTDMEEGGVRYERAPDMLKTVFVDGYDFVNDDPFPLDDNQHGTFIAGVIAQTTGNAFGAAGMLRDCSIMPVKVLDGEGLGTLSTLIAGIYYAADHGADVINLSLSFPNTVQSSPLLRQAVNYAKSMGIVVVAAAGNDGVPTVNLPAAFDECIAVGAHDVDGELCLYSNYGEGLDILAPGGDALDRNGDRILEAVIQQTFDRTDPLAFGYYYAVGTSQATAVVSATAALLKSAGIGNPEEIREIIQATAERDDALYTLSRGYGLLDPLAALQNRFEPNPLQLPMDRGFTFSDGISNHNYPEEFFSMIYATHDPDSYLIVIETDQGLYGIGSVNPFAQEDPTLFAFERMTLDDIMNDHASFLRQIRQGDGLLDLMAMHSELGTFPIKYDMRTSLISRNSTLNDLFEQCDGVIGLVDFRGTVRDEIASHGGMESLLQDVSDLLRVIEGNGGMMGLIDLVGGSFLEITEDGGAVRDTDRQEYIFTDVHIYDGDLSDMDPPSFPRADPLRWHSGPGRSSGGEEHRADPSDHRRGRLDYPSIPPGKTIR